MEPIVIVIFVFAFGLLGSVLTFVILSDRRAKRRKVADAVAAKGVDGVLADIAEERKRLEEEERDIKNNAGALAGKPGGGVAGVQLANHRQMLELDEFEKSVLAFARQQSTPGA